MEYINPNNPVYISYSWEDERNTEIEEPVNALCELMDKEGILYKRDKANGANALAPYRRNIEKAEEEIGNGEFVILALSIKYFKSPHCLYELHCILQNDGWEKRVYPVITDTLLKNSFVAIKRYLNEDLFEELSYKNIQGKKTLNFAENHFLSLIESYILDIDRINEFLVNYVTIFEKGNYDKIIKALKTAVQNGVAKLPPDPNVEMVAEPTPSNPPDFYFPIEKDLVPREKDVRKMLAKIKKNDFVNLYGFGGSGKTSLVNLFVNKHKNKFNQIAYVVVNNNIKDDFVYCINKTLNIKGIEKQENRYETVVEYLANNYQAGKTNLMVIDINAASKDDADGFIDKLLNDTMDQKRFPKGWKCLLLSRRELNDGMESMNLNENETGNSEFLKSIFAKRVGDKYDKFKDFDKLFEMLYYSPLLVEQLGIYLKKFPMQTLRQISEILGTKDYKGQKRKGITAQNRNEEENDKTLVGFLKKLIVFDDIANDEDKVLLRHFVLWPVEYIPFEVICELMHDILEQKEIKSALNRLVLRNIVSVQDGSYKLHGLIGESINEQIEIDEESFNKYIENIIDFIKNDKENRFSKYISLSLVKIFEREVEKSPDSYHRKIQLFAAYSWRGSILHGEMSFPLAEDLYLKAIAIGEKLPKDNPEYQDSLGNVYHDLAIMQRANLKDYGAAQDNYGKAIAVFENLPKDNPEYQDHLGKAYYNLANMQCDNLSEYGAAQDNYGKAIAVFEKLPKDNPEYQGHLADTYNFLAYCLSESDDYPAAFAAIEKAIAIGEILKEKDSKYLIDWINICHSLLELKFNSGEKVGLKDELIEIKALAAQCLTENPNDSWTKTINDDIDDLLGKIEG